MKEEQKKIDATDAPPEGAIEWLEQEYQRWSHEGNFIPKHIIDRAKQIQKHMVMHAYNYGFDDGVHMPPSSMSDDADENFYNQFYGTE
jgi:hypothetical protein